MKIDEQWTRSLCIDIVCLSDCGNVGDVSVMAALSALTNTKLPFVSADDEGMLFRDAS